MATARLISRYKTTRQNIDAVATPAATTTWQPVGHGQLIDMIMDKMKARNIIVDGEPAYALAKNGNQMFSTLKLKSEARADFSLAMGIRNSIDKTLAAGICCGSSVFVCENLSFSSELVFTERHTGHIFENLPQIIEKALDKFMVLGNEQELLYERMKKIEIPLETGISLIRSMGEEHKVLPSNQLYRVMSEYASPRFPEFRGYNAWTLLNACTTFCRHDRRSIDPIKEQDNLLGITRIINQHCGLSLTDASIN
jgi:hypothetical protein